ncbi:hypothetical protein SCHPADRAFT_941443 [Schizopora paradoxa]|uniref:Mid2 domain-containing protein n=1 Tax=Schizopora paradoxa TaxID=27342 RepID=A0A0H2RJI5_9AGAM|nr:hypothetical protein SCHPADRAFT_941443 [Schizopora paradoxa]
MADGIATPTLRSTITECWVYATTSGTVYSTPAEPVATGAECYVVFPTGGGVEYSPIPDSDVPFTSLPPPTHTSSSSNGTNGSTNVVGPVVGAVVGILAMTVPIMWYLTYRQRRRRRESEKHQWAMTPGKWSFPGKPETLPKDAEESEA